MTNSERAERARQALAAYTAEDDDIEANITDLLTDLRHLCNSGLIPVDIDDFDTLLETSEGHFDEERGAKPYTVWFERVEYVEVMATSSEEACDLAQERATGQADETIRIEAHED